VNPQDLKAGRKQSKLTQAAAASKLGVSQPYLSLLEKGHRDVPSNLARKAATLYRLSPTVLPFTWDAMSGQVPVVPAQTMAEDLGTLGYPGFSYLRSRRKRNPVEVLFFALAQRDLEPRLTEALPWVVLHYTNMDWQWLFTSAKQHDLQNRLGFVTTFALRVLESRRPHGYDVELLTKCTDQLEQMRLAKEDTLCHESLSIAEREWLRERRSDDARHWNLLTDLSPDQFRYAA
jgi:transcriptional regulator with XRE-family HTH domain